MPVSDLSAMMPTGAEYTRILPELILIIAGTLIMFLEAILTDDQKAIYGPLTIASLLAALVGAIAAYGNPGPAFHAMLQVDGFATFFRVLVIGVGILAVFSSMDYLKGEGSKGGEFYALLLYSIVGQSLMASANELIMIFIGLEISSIASYILAGYLREDSRNNESALKYFLLGSFATAFLLYGVAWIYGGTGSTNLTAIRDSLASASAPPIALAGTAAALMFIGLAFKVSAAPFQAWAPDVYQGAPAPVSAFLSVGPKAAAFAVMLRVFVGGFGPIASRWTPILWGCALATMIVGNFAAILQSNIKRLLAYSSIAHAGYVLVAVAANSSIGSAAVMFYMAAYAVTNIGAFAVVTYFSRHNEQYVKIQDFSGLAQRKPAMAAMLSIFLLSLIGVPLTGGFFGKFYIFKAALDSHLVWLTVLGLLNSAVAAYYYLRLIVVMYFQEPGESVENLPPVGGALQIAVYASAALTVLFGVRPDLILDFATKASLK
jgi:NADH-quinone oxidoreductase subunit N